MPQIAPPPPPAEAHLRAPEGEATVGDLIDLTLEVRHAVGTQALLPQAQEAWQGTPGLDVRSQSRPETKDNHDGTLTTRVVIRTAWFLTGRQQTPSLTVTLTDASGATQTLTVAGTRMMIRSVLTDKETELRDLKAQAEIPGPPWWLWILAAVFALLALGALIWRLLSQHRKKGLGAQIPATPPLPAWESALAELARLESGRLLDEGRTGEVFALVSDCLRAYVEGRYGVPALERTSAEIRRDLTQSGLALPQTNEFMAVLSECDLAKFARYLPLPEDGRALIQRTRALVEKTKPDEPAL